MRLHDSTKRRRVQSGFLPGKRSDRGDAASPGPADSADPGLTTQPPRAKPRRHEPASITMPPRQVSTGRCRVATAIRCRRWRSRGMRLRSSSSRYARTRLHRPRRRAYTGPAPRRPARCLGLRVSRPGGTCRCNRDRRVCRRRARRCPGEGSPRCSAHTIARRPGTRTMRRARGTRRRTCREHRRRADPSSSSRPHG
jgi:hypothetical protein